MQTLPQYYVIKRDPSNPLWEKYKNWFNDHYNKIWDFINYEYYGYVGVPIFSNVYSYLHNSPTLITLEQWYEAVNGFVLPQFWCVERTPINCEVLNKWANDTFNNKLYKNYGYVIQNGAATTSSRYDQITFDQFKKHVLKENDMYDPRLKITPKEDLLEEAKRRYPNGTMFKCANGNNWPKESNVIT